MINDIMVLLSVAAPLALMTSLWVMAQISRRYGEVTHRPPLYRGFHVALILVLCPLLVRLLAIGLTDNEDNTLGGNAIGALIYDLPLAISITLSVFIAWRYWGWLVYAHEGKSPVTSQPTE